MATAQESQHPNMKVVIFAGGVGSRMWPLSRKKSPKQFEPIMEGKSTLQLSVERLRPEMDWQDIYISTGEQYRDIIQKQLPEIPDANIVGEPEMRDVGPAVGYMLSIINKTSPGTPTAILWSDHLVDKVDVFKKALFAGAEYLSEHPNKYVFIGQKPRFANQNLGWIEYGKQLDKQNGVSVSEFVSWHYRPDQATAKKYYRGGKHSWNLGYFVVKPEFVLAQYQQHAPEMYQQLQTLEASFGTDEHERILQEVYPQMEKIDFDSVVLEKAKPEDAVVLSVDIGWSDIGTWEALKEALQTHPQENLVMGKVTDFNTSNSVVYSYTDQLVATIDINDMVVVVTEDVVMVTRQKSIPQIKKLLKSFDGTELESYT